MSIISRPTYRPGDRVEIKEGRHTQVGEILTIRGWGARQTLMVRTDSGDLVTVGVDAAGGLLAPAAAPDDAYAVAAAVMAGIEVRMPVTQLVNFLAAAVLANAPKRQESEMS